LPNNDGGVVDDLLIYKMKEEEYLLVVNASEY
jgi:aminomethyltransferase